MQDWREQAAKRSVTIMDSGPCQFCGAAFTGGVAECMEVYAEVSGRMALGLDYAQVHLITVDAHALQHPEIHGRLNNNFHLVSLAHILERGGSAAMGQRRAFLDSILTGKLPIPPLEPPPPLQRGALTVADVYAAQTPIAHEAAVRAWGQSVWGAWAAYHTWARTILAKL